ncbi:hypothetical protein [Cytophaga aurantiaca]|uniref:hypothetical protein n=1 Tax=Cytophaga aurantiaca TaxID=29530 RepID=UPI0003767E6A|nr:hypothetical protein [Cytophaga aurantiaca]
MKKIYCLILFAFCSQAYGQIHLDTATYYSHISNARWADMTDIKWNDSLPGYPSGMGTLLIDRNHYWVFDPHCWEVPLAYKVQIKDTLFILHVKDRYERMKINFYVYGWFPNDSTMKTIRSKRRIKKYKLKESIPDTYKRYSTKY